MSEWMRSILFVELMGDVGDLLIALSSIQAIAISHPDARMNVLTFASNAKLLENDSLISNVFIAPPLKNPREYWQQAECLRELLAREHFDTIVSDTMFGGIGRIVENSDAKFKVSNLWRNSPENELIEERFLSILVDEGLVDPLHRDFAGRIALSTEEQQWARVWLRNNLSGGKRIAILYPEVDRPIKRWPPERFIELGRWLAEEVRLSVIISADDDIQLAKEIATEIGSGASLLYNTDLRRFAALVANADVFISSDTTAARVAAGAGAPAVVLFGPTWSGRYGLRKPSVNLQSPRECSERRFIDFTEQSCWDSCICVFPGIRSCVESISVDTVVSELKQLLGS